MKEYIFNTGKTLCVEIPIQGQICFELADGRIICFCSFISLVIKTILNNVKSQNINVSFGVICTVIRDVSLVFLKCYSSDIIQVYQETAAFRRDI